MTTKPKKRMRLGISISAASIAFLLVLFACSQPDQNIIETGEIYENVEVMPEYPGGNYSLVKFLRENINYPEKAKREGIEGQVDVSFFIDKDGTVKDATIVKSLSEECDQEALRVINSMPAWQPGKQNNEVVRVALRLPIFFKTGYSSTSKSGYSPKESSKSVDHINAEGIYTLVKQMPEFPGGVNALMQYLGSNINYPEQAKKDSIQGKVYVQFIVEKDGKINEVKVLRGIGGGCDEEAVRVIRNMPAWNPGLNEDGEAVRVSFNIPIKYTLD
jgi:TonB family protein